MSDWCALLSDARQRKVDQSAVRFATTMDRAVTLAEMIAKDEPMRPLLVTG